MRASKAFPHMRAEANWGWLFALPWLLGLLVFYVYPLISSIYYSFTTYSILSDGQFAGVAHYKSLLQDHHFHGSIGNSLFYASIYVPLSIAASLGLALLLQHGGSVSSTYRAVFFLPAMLPLTAKAVIWLSILNPELGLANALISFVTGEEGPAWLQSESWSKLTLALLSLWGIGQLMLIAAAGLQRIPRSCYDAASMDGAGALRSFTAITLPMLRPILVYQAVTGALAALHLFTMPYALTEGEGTPGGSLMFYVMYMHQQAFLYLNMGYASAMASSLFAVTLIMTGFLALLFRRWRYD